MDTKKLRQKILDLAIRGKLVPQDPNDEPASVLLERIRAEKERLIKEGKIKRSKKTASDDEIEAPFDIPESWEWVRLKSIVSVLGDGIHGTPEYDITGNYYFINGNNLSNNKIVIKADTKKVNEKEYHTYKKELNDKTILVSINGTIGNVGHYNGEPVILGKSACYYNLLDLSFKSYITILMYTDYFLKYAVENATGSTIKNVSLAVMNDFLVPLPPIEEQKRIANEIDRWFAVIDELESNEGDLSKAIDKTKSKILDLAIRGKLVPQEPNDEPAIELLKRINPKFEPCEKDNDLPNGWTLCKLEDIVDYEQPQAYIVQSTEYMPQYKTPVLTAGKSFIIGYTNEEEGICTNLPVIIFDDFTTDSKYVDFPFKVKSSAMKILRVKEGINIQYVCHYMSITRLIGDTHKRYWISEYSKLSIPIPPYNEQLRIVAKIEELFAVLDGIKEFLN